MTRRRTDWPHGMSAALAAEFCGVSLRHFLAHCPVEPKAIGRRVVYSRRKLEAWIDGEGEAPDIRRSTAQAKWLDQLGGDARSG